MLLWALFITLAASIMNHTTATFGSSSSSSNSWSLSAAAASSNGDGCLDFANLECYVDEFESEIIGDEEFNVLWLTEMGPEEGDAQVEAHLDEADHRLLLCLLRAAAKRSTLNVDAMCRVLCARASLHIPSGSAGLTCLRCKTTARESAKLRKPSEHPHLHRNCAPCCRFEGEAKGGMPSRKTALRHIEHRCLCSILWPCSWCV